MVCLLYIGFLVVICNTKLCFFLFFCFSFTVRYVNFVPFSRFFLSLGQAFSWLCLLPTSIIVYATTI